ncbi:putative DNA binding domain-containing protein [Woeseiaceae bacterium]|nr:putative DNA binding domain-containing protein [Woeseiaceae bacterium]
MSKNNKIESLRRKYWEYIDQNKYERSLADLGVRHPSLIDLNIFVEILIEGLIESRKPKNIAKVIVGEFFVEDIFLNHINHTQFLKDKNVNKLFDELPKDKKFDLVLSSLPWGLKSKYMDDSDKKYSRYFFKNKEKYKDLTPSEDCSIRSSYEYTKSIESMEMLSDEGIGICFLPTYFQTFERSKFREMLNDNNLYIDGIIRTPNDLLRSVTMIESIFVLVSKIKKEKEFIIDIDSIDSLEKGIDSFNQQTVSENIKDGIWFESGSFVGFHKWKYQEELNKLAGDFSSFSKYKVSEICSSINRAIGGKNPKSFKDIKDCVYLPFIGNKNAVTDKNELQIKEHNHYQLVVDSSIVMPEYLASFFNSKLGKKYIESNKTGATILQLSRVTLREMEIGVPPIEEQKNIIRNIKRVNELKDKIEEFANSLSINPISDHKTLNKVDSMMEIISELSDSDRLRSIIRRGEDISTEFKQTLSLDIAKKTREKYITVASLKTIAAFFNTKGGYLLIGVDDDMNITGIDHEVDKFHKGQTDKFLNNFKDLFKQYIGPEFYPFIDQRIVDINDKKVLLISCEPSDKEVFMDGVDFYVRTTPATDKLEGQSQVDYIRTRFG